jgi:hypothetical protein
VYLVDGFMAERTRGQLHTVCAIEGIFIFGGLFSHVSLEDGQIK